MGDSAFDSPLDFCRMVGHYYRKVGEEMNGLAKLAAEQKDPSLHSYEKNMRLGSNIGTIAGASLGSVKSFMRHKGKVLPMIGSGLNKEHELAKQASEQDHEDLAGRASSGVGGAALLGASVDPLIGRKTLFHGTSKESANRIKHEGFKASKGGSGAAAVDPAYIKNSEGHIHMSGIKGYSNFYANLADAENPLKGQMKDYTRKVHEFNHLYGVDPEVQAKREEMKQRFKEAESTFQKGMFRNLFRPHNKKRVEILKTQMPYSEYDKHFVLDEDAAPFRHMAGKTKEDIGAERVVGSEAFSRLNQAKELAREFPTYVKKYPKRFGAGLGLAALGTTGLVRAMHPGEDR